MSEDKDSKTPLPEITRWCFAVNDRACKLMELFIPLPCFDYLEEMGECDEFDCPSIDGEDPLCRTRRLLADQLASAIQINRYDPLHPEYDELPDSVKDLILKAHELKHGGPFPQQEPSQEEEK